MPITWGILPGVAVEWDKARIAEQAAALQRETMGRGFTADEIIRVIDAGTQLENKIAGKTPQPSGRR